MTALPEGEPRGVEHAQQWASQGGIAHVRQGRGKGAREWKRLVKKLNEYAMKTVNIQCKNEYNPK
jgi:hypothetical protein